MSDPVIIVENLSKRYVIGHRRSKDDGIRHMLEDAVRAPLQWFGASRQRKEQAKEDFWALKDVSFEVRQGDVMGIVGRNGAGKSTLLKILSRITEPTKGRIQINGRVASLLEVGTGFHPELTGRENIFLNGAILGMHRVEIRKKFDEIVAFSEVERFLDTPVKRYSSGMYVRLAFAVAAHLEPEILIVDEVLAVGDSTFQRKCLGKMGEVAKSGRTILFVSHNLGAVTQLCNECLYLANGSVVIQGKVDPVVAEYTRRTGGAARTMQHNKITVSSTFSNPDGSPLQVWEYMKECLIEVKVISEEKLPKPAIDVVFYDERGIRVFALLSDAYQNSSESPDAQIFTLHFIVRNPGLVCQSLSVDIGLRTDGRREYLCWWQSVDIIPIVARNVPFRTAPDSLIALPFEAKFTHSKP